MCCVIEKLGDDILLKCLVRIVQNIENFKV